MLEVIDGGKADFDRLAGEIRTEIKKRRKNGEAEWDNLDYIIETCREKGIKASETAAIVYMMYRLRND